MGSFSSVRVYNVCPLNRTWANKEGKHLLASNAAACLMCTQHPAACVACIQTKIRKRHTKSIEMQQIDFRRTKWTNILNFFRIRANFRVENCALEWWMIFKLKDLLHLIVNRDRTIFAIFTKFNWLCKLCSCLPQTFTLVYSRLFTSACTRFGCMAFHVHCRVSV